jgi:outer membrane lipoprotein-sorting protein
MKPARLIPVLCTTLVLLSAASAVAEDFATVEKAVREKWNALKSFRGNMHTVMDIDTEGYKSHTDSKGIYEIVREGKQFKMRMESKTAGETTMGEQTSKTAQESLMIMDAEFMYSYNVSDGQKSAMKMKNPSTFEDLDPFAAWSDGFNLTVLPDEDVDGASCYVVQATPKEGDMGMSKMVQYIRKDCGMTVKSVSFAENGKPMTTTTFSDIEINPTIAADRFVFKAPEGVEVMDMSAMMEQAADSDGGDDDDGDDEP